MNGLPRMLAIPRKGPGKGPDLPSCYSPQRGRRLADFRTIIRTHHKDADGPPASLYYRHSNINLATLGAEIFGALQPFPRKAPKRTAHFGLAFIT